MTHSFHCSCHIIMKKIKDVAQDPCSSKAWSVVEWSPRCGDSTGMHFGDLAVGDTRVCWGRRVVASFVDIRVGPINVVGIFPPILVLVGVVGSRTSGRLQSQDFVFQEVQKAKPYTYCNNEESIRHCQVEH